MQRNTTIRRSFSKRINNATENSKDNDAKKGVLPVITKTIAPAKATTDQQTGNMKQNVKKNIQIINEVPHQTEKKSKNLTTIETFKKRLEQAEEILKKYSPIPQVVKKDNPPQVSKLVKQPSGRVPQKISKSESFKKKFDQVDKISKKYQPIKQEVKTGKQAIEKPNQKELLTENTQKRRESERFMKLSTCQTRKASEKTITSQQGVKKQVYTPIAPRKKNNSKNISNSDTFQKSNHLLDKIFEKYKSIHQGTKQSSECVYVNENKVDDNEYSEADLKTNERDSYDKENKPGPMQTRLEDEEQILLNMSLNETDFVKKMEILEKISDFQRQENEKTVTILSDIMKQADLIFNNTF